MCPTTMRTHCDCAYQDDNDKLRQRISDMSTKDEVQDLHARILQTQFSEVHEANYQLNKENDELVNDIHDVTYEYDELRADFDEAAQRIRMLQYRVSTLVKDKDQLLDELEVKSEMIEQLQENMNQQLAKNAFEQADLKASLQRATLDQNHMCNAMEAMTQERDELEGQNAEMSAVINDLEPSTGRFKLQKCELEENLRSLLEQDGNREKDVMHQIKRENKVETKDQRCVSIFNREQKSMTTEKKHNKFQNKQTTRHSYSDGTYKTAQPKAGRTQRPSFLGKTPNRLNQGKDRRASFSDVMLRIIPSKDKTIDTSTPPRVRKRFFGASIPFGSKAQMSTAFNIGYFDSKSSPIINGVAEEDKLTSSVTVSCVKQGRASSDHTKKIRFHSDVLEDFHNDGLKSDSHCGTSNVSGMSVGTACTVQSTNGPRAA